MIPLILVSNRDKEAKDFIKNYISKKNYTQDRVIEVTPLKKEIVISQIREIRKRLLISTRLPRLFVFYSFDKATTEAQNAFLKSLEESTLDNQFILVVENEHLILTTVRSRSNITRLLLPKKEDKSEASYLNLLKEVETDSDFSFIARASLKSSTQEEVSKLMEVTLDYYRNKLAVEPLSVPIIKKTLYLKALLDANNLNPQVTIDNLLIFIFKAFRMKI